MAGRDFRNEPTTEEESARVFAAFGPRVPDADQRARAARNPALGPVGMELVRQTDIRDQLSRIASPTLVVVGALDAVTPVGAAQEVVDALPEGISQLEVIDGAGHWTWKDAPQRFWPIILGFIERTAGNEVV